ncbi:hypothetical protein AAG906_013097 [Vitis piasezkii]
MKHFMQPRNTILRETDSQSSSSSASSPNPNSVKQRSASRKQKWSKENAPPSDLNTMADHSSPSLAAKSLPPSGKIRSPLPPRPPSSNSNPLKRKLSMDTVPENAVPGASDSGVRVIVRMRPPNKDEEEGEVIAQKMSGDSLSILGQTFTFDSVADAESTQLDIFQLVGSPLVENCLSGFNSSVFAYGQTGSGKTYTMWGPANALLDENLSNNKQGLTPRVFEQLFARINEEQIKHADKQLKYQCRCSFLEIYNEQITDLLDPSQKNLQIREDVKSGVYVENLTEEYVCTMKDVTQLLIKEDGATSINAESSRQIVFYLLVESSTSDGISSFKTSRINLVDLAGSERQKLTGAAGDRLKEAGNINRSLSQLGNLINILAEVSQTGKQRHIPYRDSRLTFLLQESLGGNAKLAMVCAISPVQSCKSETLSTLRFAQRAKAIKNKAVVNEVMQDDVNFLRGVIRQLKDELLRMKANGNQPTDSNGSYSTGWNARRSLNLLKFSLNRPTTLPHVDDDGDEEMEIDEEAVEKLWVQVGLQSVNGEENSKIDVGKIENVQSDSQFMASEEGIIGEPQSNMSQNECIKEEASEDTDVNMEEEISEQIEKHETVIVDCGEQVKNTQNSSQTDLLSPHNQSEINEDESQIHLIVSMPNENPFEQFTEEKSLLTPLCNLPNEEPLSKVVENSPTCQFSESVGAVSLGISEVEASNDSPNGLMDGIPPSNLSIVPCNISPVLKSPTLSVSPRVSNNSRKSLRTSSMLTASQKDLRDESKLDPEPSHTSFAKSIKNSSVNPLSSQSNKKFLASTEHLAASLHRGLEIIDVHRQSSALRRSSFRFSFKPADTKPILPVDKVDAPEEESEAVLCSNCKSTIPQVELKEAFESSNLQLVPVDGSQSADKSKKQVPKAVEKVLAGAIRREMALEEFCTKQTSEIMQLNRLIQQYKHERECNSIIGQTREDKIIRLRALWMLLKEKYENHPEVLRTKLELKRVQDELERYRNFFDMGERDVLLEEIQDLRSHLQYYIDSSPMPPRKRSPLLQLTYSCQPSLTPPLFTISESTGESAEEKLEQERLRWTETESKWISLSEELRDELEASRSLAEKQKVELDSEKKCAEELKEAMQLAMEGHARMLEQYAELEERHMALLARHRKIQEGIDDVKKAAAKAGVKGAESNGKRERERYLRDENRGLQAQLRDTAEAVQAAGELLVRLKEAEEAVATAQKQAMEAEQETEKAYKQIEKLKKKHEKEISTLNQFLAESRLPKKALTPTYDDSEMAKYDAGESHTACDQQWREEFEPFYNGEDSELSKLAEPSSWFSGYDRCNI